MAAKIQLNHIATVLALLASGSALAHGYISQPESRNYLCKTGGNSQCGGVQWEPQSVEGPSGFPQSGPQDGQIASAGSPRWSELNIQTSDRWTKREVQPGPFAISWTFTANHVTRNWRYYLTKQDWNPNQPLTRASFDLTPFCVIDGNMVQPPKQVTHNCILPERTGYQVILGVWEVGDTSNSFYNIIDAKFKDGSQPPLEWSQSGTIYPSIDLAAGDKAMTRVFDANGERPDLFAGMAAQGGWKLFARCIASSFLFLVGVSLFLAHGEAFRRKPFALLAGSYFVCGFQLAFFTLHLPAYVVDMGLSANIGMTAVAMIGLFNIFGSFLSGWLGGLYSKKWLLAWIYALRIVAILALMLFPLSPLTLYVFAAVMGLLWLGTVPLTSGLVGCIFGMRYVGMLYGIVFLGHQIGGFLGAWLGGRIFDLSGSYEMAWWLSIALSVMAAALSLPVREAPLLRAEAR